MTLVEHLDKIYSLGFQVDLYWNESIDISYNANDVFPATAYSVVILSCSYYKSKEVEYSFSDLVECVCDVFYEWYNKNLSVLNEFDEHYDPKALEKLENVCPRDVTKQVARDLNLTDILRLFK